MRVKIIYFMNDCLIFQTTNSLILTLFLSLLAYTYQGFFFFKKIELDAEGEATCLRCQEKLPNLISLKNHLMRKHSAIVSVVYLELRRFLHAIIPTMVLLIIHVIIK